jgi:hypothetical protein
VSGVECVWVEFVRGTDGGGVLVDTKGVGTCVDDESPEVGLAAVGIVVDHGMSVYESVNRFIG